MRKITFGCPYHLESPADGIEIEYPFEIISSDFENPESRTLEKFRIKVLVDPHLAGQWGFRMWKPSSTYDRLIKLVLPDVIRHIKIKIHYGPLEKIEEFELINSITPVNVIHHLENLPEVEGYEEVI